MTKTPADQEFADLLLARLQLEHSQVICGNFVLDIQLGLSRQQAAALMRENDALRVKLNDAERANDELKAQINPARGDRFKKARRPRQASG